MWGQNKCCFVEFSTIYSLYNWLHDNPSKSPPKSLALYRVLSNTSTCLLPVKLPNLLFAKIRNFFNAEETQMTNQKPLPSQSVANKVFVKQQFRQLGWFHTGVMVCSVVNLKFNITYRKITCSTRSFVTLLPPCLSVFQKALNEAETLQWNCVLL